MINRRHFCATAAGMIAARTARGQSAAPKLIDLHHHILPPQYVEAVGSANIGAPAGGAKAPDWSPATSIETMDATGIQTAMTSISAPGFPFNDRAALLKVVRGANDYAAQLAADHPGRFGIFAAMPLPDVDASIAELEYVFGKLSVDGVGLLTSYSGVYPGDRQFARFFSALEERKATVFFHPTPCTCSAGISLGLPAAAIEYPQETTRTVSSLLFSGTLQRCPNVKCVFSHAGGTIPFIAGRIANRQDPGIADPGAQLKKLYYDTAQAMNPITLPAALKFAGEGQLVFGSDFPFIRRPALETSVRSLPDLLGSEAVLRRVARENALSILPQLKRKLEG
jgi:predicted TIM-barrel fold metal-dependent hydrolase